jgi:type I restriction enzyme S subunit
MPDSDGIELGSASDFSYGSAAKSAPSGNVPVLRMGNIQDGNLDWSDLVYTSDPREIEKYRLTAGDVLFNRTNSPALVGKTAVYRGERPAIYAGYLIRVRCGERLDPEYLAYCLNSSPGRDYCRRVKTDGVSQSNINAKKLAAFEFKLPSMDEQREIVRRIEAAMDWLNIVATEQEKAARLLDHLDQGLLAKAFCGELVPQDPNDETAETLLERIRAARSTEPKSRRGRRARAAA